MVENIEFEPWKDNWYSIISAQPGSLLSELLDRVYHKINFANGGRRGKSVEYIAAQRKVLWWSLHEDSEEIKRKLDEESLGRIKDVYAFGSYEERQKKGIGGDPLYDQNRAIPMIVDEILNTPSRESPCPCFLEKVVAGNVVFA